jgi:hypothetical protein
VIVLAAIDTGALLEVVWVSLVAGALITGAFSLGLYGITRYGEIRRAGNETGAALFLAVGVFGLAVFVAAVVIGFVLMVRK